MVVEILAQKLKLIVHFSFWSVTFIMVAVPTDDFLLELIQTDPESKTEDEVLKKHSPLGGALPGSSSGSGSSWETVSESRLMAING